VPLPPDPRVLIVHGIGQARAGFSGALAPAAEAAMRSALARFPQPPADAARLLATAETTWDAHVAREQAALRDVLARDVGFQDPGGRWGWWSALLGRGAFLLRAHAVPFIGDILAYQREDAKTAIYGELDVALDRLAPAGAAACALTVVAHSLGTVIASDYFWDRTAGRRRAEPRAWRLANFFTLGSPMAFFALRYDGRPEGFDDPLRMETAAGRWLNFYSPEDVVATPLARLNAVYAGAVRDVKVDTGWLLAAHQGYWRSADVQQAIGHKLALDWLRDEGRPGITALQERYDRTLRIA
jgi:hypothetical protein